MAKYRAKQINKKKLTIPNIVDQSKQFFCSVTNDGQDRCKEQCQFCIDWVDDAQQQINCAVDKKFKT